jgi:DNA-binding NarL/FixJ family response regulator
MKTYTIAITDDEGLFRKGLSRILSEVPAFEVLFEAANGRLLLEQLKQREVHPRVLLLDMQMPEMDGVDSLKAVKAAYPDIEVIILTSHYNATLIIKMIELGASAFLAKNTAPEELITTIRNVAEHGFHYDSYIVKLLRERMTGAYTPPQGAEDVLTNREREVLELICQQYTNKEIADKLHISPRTVEGHRNNMLDKTGSKNTVGLVFYAIEQGVVRLEELCLG